MEARDLVKNLEPFDPTFSKTVGETYGGEREERALIQGCRVVRREKWDENPSKSNQLSHVQPHPLLRCNGDWIGRKILLQNGGNQRSIVFDPDFDFR